MEPKLLQGFGNFVSIDSRKFVIANKLNNTREEYFIRNLPFDNLVITSHTGSISFEALRFLVKHNVMVTTLSFNGDLLSVTLPAAPASAFLRIKQYQAYLDPNKRYYIANQIISQKLWLQLSYLRELSKFYDIDISAVEKAFDSENKFCNKKTIEALITKEGRCADIYWSELIKVVNQLYPEFEGFTSRNNDLNSHNRHAASAPSSLWNYIYSIGEAECKRVLNYIGFDGSVSFIHSLEQQNGRQNFVFDVLELYRVFCDIAVISLLEEKHIRSSDFIITYDTYTYRLKEQTAKLLINKLKGVMNQRAIYKSGQNFTYQNILYNEVRRIANYITGKQDKLEFNIPLIRINRNDELQLRNRIMSITTEERKKLGLNKSSVWTAQKNIRLGKRIKVYKKVLVKLQ